MDSALEKNKKRFRYLRNTFRFAMVWWVMLYIIANFYPDSPGLITGIWFTLGVVNGFAYLYLLGTLASQARKNASLWVLGAFIFPILGVALTYLNMKTIAIQNSWD